jgi:hypothetical protein
MAQMPEIFYTKGLVLTKGKLPANRRFLLPG